MTASAKNMCQSLREGDHDGSLIILSVARQESADGIFAPGFVSGGFFMVFVCISSLLSDLLLIWHEGKLVSVKFVTSIIGHSGGK